LSHSGRYRGSTLATSGPWRCPTSRRSLRHWPTEAPDLAHAVGKPNPLIASPAEVDPVLEPSTAGGEQLALDRAKATAGPRRKGEGAKDAPQVVAKLDENLRNLATLALTLPVWEAEQGPGAGAGRARRWPHEGRIVVDHGPDGLTAQGESLPLMVLVDGSEAAARKSGGARQVPENSNPWGRI
jgi:hypothetical protein